MSPTNALVARFMVTEGIHRFFDLVDRGQASATADLFHADATLTFGPGSPQPGTVQGAAIKAAMQARENLKTAFTRHFIGNIIFDQLSSKDAQVRYQMILFRSDDATREATPAFVADVSETWEAEEGGFKIRARTVTPTFTRS